METEASQIQSLGGLYCWVTLNRVSSTKKEEFLANMNLDLHSCWFWKNITINQSHFRNTERRFDQEFEKHSDFLLRF